MTRFNFLLFLEDRKEHVASSPLKSTVCRDGGCYVVEACSVDQQSI